MFLLRLKGVRLLLRGLGLGVLSALVALFLSAAGALSPLERGVSNALFRLRGPRVPQSRVALLVVDDATATAAGRMPLPRQFYSQTIQKLRAEGARVIAFDFVFSTPSNDPKQDALLAQTVAAQGDITQGVIFDASGGVANASTLKALPGFALADRGGSARLALSIEAPLRAMVSPNSGLGHLNFRPEPGGEVRHIPHLIRFGGHLYPSLALSAAIQARGETAADWSAAPGQISAPDGQTSVTLDPNGETLVNWLGNGEVFPTYSMIDLLQNRAPRGAFRGATVFVGSARAGTFTPLTTPFSAAVYNNQSALHLQANAFDDIVSNRVLRPLPTALQGLILTLFSLGAGVLIARRGALGALVWIGTGVLALLSIGVLLLFANLFLPLGTPLVALILTGASCLGVRQQREGRELRVMHELFDGYVGDEVLHLIKSNRPKLDGELRHVSILFCDIRGFSGIAEGLRDDPEKLLRLLNNHFEPITQSLKQHGAYVDNLVGDLVMAVFGAPTSTQSSDRNTRNAVFAALDILRIVATRNREREAAGEPRIEIGIGIHCGPAVVGELRTSRKKHYTAIGDTVNIASRVEGQTRVYNTTFLVTEEVVLACQDHPDTSHFTWELRAEASVKGRQNTVKLFSNPEFDL